MLMYKINVIEHHLQLLLESHDKVARFLTECIVNIMLRIQQDNLTDRIIMILVYLYLNAKRYCSH
ncbi:hypothetical protein CAXC1_280005 [Candidatus Xenohaliotis californiensis]|uniref:Uncharacterized protein n=1 Tax=Candidatus Xenohaliotis californiensis TaxID=84677 RepID=A0ABM9N871_9RICK|nr:hypothetical protein CAXC1_280005 [Candidatus Xenohaliotis californiensis]